MKVWQVFNRYRESVNGEEQAVINTHELLSANGVQSLIKLEDSNAIGGIGRKLAAAFGGVYNLSAYRRISRAIQTDRPDLVHAHNLLPLYSPSVLKACVDNDVPVVLTVHNFFLTCPIYTHFRNEKPCVLCSESSELACVFQNCKGNYFESTAYALRTWTARIFQLYLRYATKVIALTQFAQRGLIDYGFDANDVFVLPNFSTLQANPADLSANRYVAYAGRLNAAKGIDVLLQAAARVKFPVRIAGGDRYCGTSEPPKNVEFVGVLNRQDMLKFFLGARFVVVPSRWFEMCPLVIAEAMSLGLPVIVSRIGGLPELVGNGDAGLLFEPGNVQELAEQMQRLWDDRSLCARLGAAAYEFAQVKYSPSAHFRSLRGLYSRAVGG